MPFTIVRLKEYDYLESSDVVFPFPNPRYRMWLWVIDNKRNWEETSGWIFFLSGFLFSLTVTKVMKNPNYARSAQSDQEPTNCGRLPEFLRITHANGILITSGMCETWEDRVGGRRAAAPGGLGDPDSSPCPLPLLCLSQLCPSSSSWRWKRCWWAASCWFSDRPSSFLPRPGSGHPRGPPPEADTLGPTPRQPSWVSDAGTAYRSRLEWVVKGRSPGQELDINCWSSPVPGSPGGYAGGEGVSLAMSTSWVEEVVVLSKWYEISFISKSSI